MKTPLTSSATMTEASERAAAVEFTAGWFGSPRGSAAPLGGGNAGAFSMGSSAGSGGKSARLRKGHHE